MATITLGDGSTVEMIREGFTVRFVDRLGGVGRCDFAPRDAATLAALAPECDWLAFRSLAWAARDVARREPLTRENLLAALA